MKRDGLPVKGIAAHGAAAGLGLARTLRSRADDRYREKYLGRYKRARLFFLIDGLVLAVLAALVGFNLYLLAEDARQTPDIDLSLSAPQIETARPLAFQANMRLRGNEAHEDVVLFWTLPPGTEVLQATPPLGPDGRVNIGRIEPGEELSAKIVVRLFTDAPGASFGFRLHERGGAFAGGITKPVVGSGLRISPFIEASAVAEGASIPYLIKNDTQLDIDNIEVTAIDGGSIQGGNLAIGRLESLERRVFLFAPERPGDGFRVSAGGRTLYEIRPEFSVSDDPAWNRLEIDPAPSSGTTTYIGIETADRLSVLVYHPGFIERDRVKRFDIDPTVKRLPVAVDPGLVGDAREYVVLPVLESSAGSEIGPAIVGTITTAFAPRVQARFYAKSGDQLGVGSLPPTVGEEITFWILPELAKTTADIRDLRLEMRLAPGVRLTGNTALPYGGEISESGDTVTWTSAYLPRSEFPVHAAFEIRVTPEETLRGTYIPFILDWKADAIEIRSGELLRGSGSTVDSSMPEDERAAGSGRVK